ncbi:MAG TPA: ArsA-related P-loop ATPase [Actinomycetota bacterium]|nr:ArsA-related P-loop ATPase [Actinomycetota bacterium]
MSLESALDGQIVICAGPGGVGKTTVSAAIALEGALRGRTTCVVTIDPAKRLADALGLEELSNQPRRVAPEKFEEAGLPPAPLDAMMLDTKTTFDDLVHRYARSPEKAKSIIDNRFYQAISGALNGTHEYMAMEKLYELYWGGRYDLIVVDTPPTRNALDFLEAPKRMTSFLEGKLLKWFLVPAMGGGRGVFRAMNLAAVTFLRVVQKVIGAEALADTADFFANFEGMYDGFKERAQAVYELLRRNVTRFVVVVAPTDQAVEEALFLVGAMSSHGLAFGGLVVNRLQPRFPEALGEPIGSPLADRLTQIAGELERVRHREEHSLRRLEAEVPPRRWVRVPTYTQEVANLHALAEVTDALFAEPEHLAAP